MQSADWFWKQYNKQIFEISMPRGNCNPNRNREDKVWEEEYEDGKGLSSNVKHL